MAVAVSLWTVSNPEELPWMRVAPWSVVGFGEEEALHDDDSSQRREALGS